MASEKHYDFKDWEGQPFFQNNAQQITDSIRKWHGASFRLARILEVDYPDTAAVAQELRGQIEEFQKNLPLITSLLSPANGAEEWEEIRRLMPTLTEDFGSPENNLSLKNLLEMGAMDHIEEIEITCHKAEKKF